MSEKAKELLRKLSPSTDPLTDTKPEYTVYRPMAYCGGTKIGAPTWRERIGHARAPELCTPARWCEPDSLVWGEVQKEEVPPLVEGYNFLRLDNGATDILVVWRD